MRDLVKEYLIKENIRDSIKSMERDTAVEDWTAGAKKLFDMVAGVFAEEGYEVTYRIS